MKQAGFESCTVRGEVARRGTPWLAGIAFLMFAIGGASIASAQNVIHLSDETVFAGSPATVAVTLDTAQEIYGFTFGARHDAAVLTPTGVNPGSALATMNGGAGPEYFYTELAPVNGPGLYVACVFDLGAFDSPLAAGTGQQAATIDYTTSAGAAAGSTTAVTLASDLGVPAVVNAFSTGQTIVPALDDGSVTFDVPAPTGTTCALLDNCACDFSISWTNGAAYTAIEVRVGGVLTQTLGGGATSTSISLAAPGASANVDVRGVIGALSSADDSCTATCPAIVPAPLPAALNCVIASSDPVSGCTVDLSWIVGGTYSAITIELDGVVVSTLGGGVGSETLALPVSATPQTICLTATDECGDPIAGSVCCEVTCFPGTQFVRGDCNHDGGFDISDAIRLLGILFNGEAPATCNDACDSNDDGGFDISDAIFLLGTLFQAGANPPAPYPNCGLDGTDTDALDCVSFPPC